MKKNGNQTAGQLESTIPEPETEEQLDAVLLELGKLAKEDARFNQLRQQLSLFHKMYTVPDLSLAETDIGNIPQTLLMADFADEEEAFNVVAALQEDIDEGMDLSLDINYVMALAATNRKGSKNNRSFQLMDAFSHQKFTSNNPKGKNNDIYTNPRSPLNG